MPICPFDGTEMVRVKGEMLIRGEGWNRKQVYREEYTCSNCAFRVAIYYHVLSVGRKGKRVTRSN